MKALLSIFCILISISLFSQERLKFYYDVEALVESENIEEAVTFEKQIANHTSEVDTLSASIYAIFGEVNLVLSNFEKSTDYYSKALETLEKLELKISENYSDVLYNLTDVYLTSGKLDKAKSSANQLLSLDGELFGKSSLRYVETVFFLTDVLIELGQYDLALKTLNKESKNIDDEFFESLINTKKADLFTLLGNYDQSVKLLESSMDVYSDLEDTLSFTLGQASLGLNYIAQGKYPQAENILQESRNLFNAIPDTDFYIDNVDNNMALAQMALGRSSQAIAVYSKLLEKDSLYFGVDHPKYISSLINIGMAYNDLDKYENAEQAMTRALDLCDEVYGKESRMEALIQMNLAIIQRDNGDYQTAINSFITAENLYKKTLGKDQIEYSTALFNKGVTYLLMNSDKAENALLSSLQLRKKLVGESHPKYAESANYLGVYYWKNNDLKKARKYFQETFVNFFDQIKQFFPVLSEEEKTKFYYNNLKPAFEQNASLTAQMMNESPEMLGELYNYQLRTKGIIMVATERLRNNIFESGDSTLIKDFTYWKEVKERLSKLYSNNDPRKDYIDSLKQVSNTLEKTLVDRSSTFASIYNKSIPTWEQVKNRLKDNEVAIEIIRYRLTDLEKGGQLTEKINYLALVINNKSSQPTAVLLERGNLMEGRYLNNYRNSIRYQITDKFTYEELWKPISDKIQEYKKVYISPDGVYNQVNLSTLVNPTTGDYLIKEFIIQEVTSTRDLVNEENTKTSSSSKVFFGFPTYTTSGAESVATKQERSLRGGLRGSGFSETRGLRGGLLRYMRSGEGISTLPGTKKEVEEITDIYKKQDEVVQTLLTTEANESSLKNIKSPEILHIATHGYFLANPKPANFSKSETYYQNPLLRSGLIMAGAEDFLLTGANSIDAEDGILTAYEAMNIELNNTDLVVLSACETGLGEIANGEGVFGLQRAFKIAGAKHIVMSMWNVDDDATQRLMTLFYENLATGASKFDAFRNAQLQLMDEYEQPFYWGAFKIVGE